MRRYRRRERLRLIAIDFALLACCAGLWHLPVPPRIARPAYDQIKLGMTEAEAKAILPASAWVGKTPRKRAQSLPSVWEGAEKGKRWAKWQGGTGTLVLVYDANNVVIGKHLSTWELEGYESVLERMLYDFVNEAERMYRRSFVQR